MPIPSHFTNFNLNSIADKRDRHIVADKCDRHPVVQYFHAGAATGGSYLEHY